MTGGTRTISEITVPEIVGASVAGALGWFVARKTRFWQGRKLRNEVHQAELDTMMTALKDIETLTKSVIRLESAVLECKRDCRAKAQIILKLRHDMDTLNIQTTTNLQKYEADFKLHREVKIRDDQRIRDLTDQVASQQMQIVDLLSAKAAWEATLQDKES